MLPEGWIVVDSVRFQFGFQVGGGKGGGGGEDRNCAKGEFCKEEVEKMASRLQKGGVEEIGRQSRK